MHKGKELEDARHDAVRGWAYESKYEGAIPSRYHRSLNASYRSITSVMIPGIDKVRCFDT